MLVIPPVPVLGAAFLCRAPLMSQWSSLHFSTNINSFFARPSSTYASSPKRGSARLFQVRKADADRWTRRRQEWLTQGLMESSEIRAKTGVKERRMDPSTHQSESSTAQRASSRAVLLSPSHFAHAALGLPPSPIAPSPFSVHLSATVSLA